jgi:hypothetical protein
VAGALRSGAGIATCAALDLKRAWLQEHSIARVQP